MAFVWILGGTSEGRLICEECSKNNLPAKVSVASGYGAELVEGLEGIDVRMARMDLADMLSLIEEGAGCAVDATHPYAVNVSRNAQEACKQKNIPYFRVLRAETSFDDKSIIRVESASDAASLLMENAGNVLLATGVNSLDRFTSLPDFKKRLSVRVLPDKKSIDRCHDLGYSSDQIIAMKGPFSFDFNVALMKDRKIKYLVSKDGGSAGGAKEKLDAAKACDATLILIERPQENLEGCYGSIDEAIDFACEKLGSKRRKFPLFPVFIDLSRKTVLVVGGGRIASRRAEILLEYGADVCIIAPEISEEMPENVRILRRKYERFDCKGSTLVLAATDDAALNAEISEEAKNLGIPVSCASDAKHGTFSFPATFREGNVSIGLTAKDPKHSKELSKSLKENWSVIAGKSGKNC